MNILAGFLAIAYLVLPLAPASADAPRSTDAAVVLGSMTLDEKIGQLIIGGFNGKTLNDETKLLLKKYKVGGFNILGGNVSGAAQSRKLIKDLKAYAAAYQPLPLLVATDQEGGLVSRFKFLKESTPQFQIATGSEAFFVAGRRARELKNLGVDMVFSPVLDFVTSSSSYLYPRSFERSALSTILLGIAMVKGYEAGKVIAVPKHFPGYNDMKPDPHRVSYVLNDSSSSFRTAVDIFENVINVAQPKAIMTAHIVIPSIDPLPATLSPKILGSLRAQGFEGVIITDDLGMASATNNENYTDTVIKAIVAGNDMIIYSFYPQRIPLLVAAIKRAVENGKITEERINRSVLRIIKIKQGLDS